MPVPKSRLDIRRAAPWLAGLAGAALALGAAAPAAAQGCAGCVPLDDLTAAPYRGVHAPGLYPGATNRPPAAHRPLVAQAIAAIVPRDTAGLPDPAGLIGLLAIGMSNTNQEFTAFERAADRDPARHGRVVIVDGAVGGQSADVIANPLAGYWTTVRDRVAAAGLDRDQVQVVWMKQADGAVPDTSFPAHAETLAAHAGAVVRILKDTFPRLAACFLASRVYGGYTTSPQRGEPLSFEGGYAFRWLIEDQMNGDPALNADPAAGPVEAPALVWGPYLWANGAIPRPSDGLTWLPADFENDHVHPAASGENKVGALLEAFFGGDSLAAPWFASDGTTALTFRDAVADAYVDDAQPATNFGADSVLRWANPALRSHVRFDLEGLADSVVHAKLSLRTPPEAVSGPTDVRSVADATWGELTITSANAPAAGPLIGSLPAASRGTALGLDVTAAVRAALALPAGSRRLALEIRPRAGGASQALSREANEPARLIITTVATTVSAGPPSGRGAEIAIAAAPNPASARIELAVTLAAASAEARLAVHDLHGRLVRVLHDGPLGAGRHRFAWDGRDGAGATVPAGLYLARIAPAGGAGAAARIAWVR